MGNVSYLVPSIHPMIKVAPTGVPIHTVEFAEWAGSAEGDQAVLDGAKAMAMTVVDLWTSADLRERDARRPSPRAPSASRCSRRSVSPPAVIRLPTSTASP